MSATLQADSGGKSWDDSSDCRLSNRELCTTKFHCSECHCFMNFTKYEKIKAKERENEQMVSQMLSWWRGWNPRSNCNILMLVLSRAWVSYQHQLLWTFKILSKVRCYGLRNYERQFVSHFPVKVYEYCICYDKLWMPETEISLHPRCANALPAMQLLCIHKTYNFKNFRPITAKLTTYILWN